MDTSPMLRGNFYPTHLTARCPSFHACLVCQACKNYDHNDKACQVCESRKPQGPCYHKDNQETIVMEMTKRFRKPMFHPDQTLSDVNFSVAEEEDAWDVKARILSEKYGRNVEKLGAVSPILEA